MKHGNQIFAVPLGLGKKYCYYNFQGEHTNANIAATAI